MKDAAVIGGDISSIQKQAFLYYCMSIRLYASSGPSPRVLTSFETIDRRRDLNSARQQVGERREQNQERQSQGEGSPEHDGLSSVDRHDASIGDRGVDHSRNTQMANPLAVDEELS